MGHMDSRIGGFHIVPEGDKYRVKAFLASNTPADHINVSECEVEASAQPRATHLS